MSKYAKLTGGIIAAWFVFSLVASALHLYTNGPNQPPLPLGLAALTPIVLFLGWFLSSAKFREFALSLSPRTLTLVQSWRIAGFTFLALAAYGILPGLFALPAGWGDIAIGATAPFVALGLAAPGHRKSFIFWQLLGITDLVTAVALGPVAEYAQPSRNWSSRDDCAPHEFDSHIWGAAIPDLAHHLHRAGGPLARRRGFSVFTAVVEYPNPQSACVLVSAERPEG